nr:reverse transcriptase domain-containing protein [Tanacetum cinerariifolium]
MLQEASETPRKLTGPVSRREDWFHGGGQLEIALESGKLNHLIKDVRQKGQGNAKGREAGKDKVINMIRSWPDDKERKSVERDESWMKAPILFPPLSMEDASIEPFIIEAIMEGYLVRRVAVKEHPDGLGRFRRGHGETIGEDRVGSGLSAMEVSLGG